MTQPTEEKERRSQTGADFLQWKQFAILVSTKNLILVRMGIHFVGGHKHSDRVCEGKATQLCQSCDIFVEFWVSILPSSKIFCWTEGCTQPLPASINCVYSFNEFMCLWCGLKVKLIPDGRAHYYSERDLQNIVNNLLSKLLGVKTTWRGEVVTLLRWRNSGCNMCGHLMRDKENMFSESYTLLRTDFVN